MDFNVFQFSLRFVTDDRGRGLPDKGGAGGGVGDGTGRLGEKKRICPWVVGRSTLSAFFSASFLPLRNDDTLL